MRHYSGAAGGRLVSVLRRFLHRIPRVARIAGAAAAAVALLAASCAQPSASNAPTIGAFGDIPDNYATMCMSLQGSTRIISGMLSVRNKSNSTVTITDALISEPHGVQVTGARIGPLLNGDLVGLQRGIVADEPSRRAMRATRPAIGARVSPGRKVQLVLMLRVDPGGGTAGHERLLYTDADGTEHVYDGSMDFLFPARKCPRSLP